MRFRLETDSTAAILARRGLEKGGRVQKYIDSEVIRLSRPYTPFLSGALMRSAESGTESGSGEVVYNSPYGRYQYYGKVMVGRAPKTVTDRVLTYSGAPKRGAKWFERMKADCKDDILRGAALIAGGRAE